MASQLKCDYARHIAGIGSDAIEIVGRQENKRKTCHTIEPRHRKSSETTMDTNCSRQNKMERTKESYTQLWAQNGRKKKSIGRFSNLQNKCDKDINRTPRYEDIKLLN